MSVLTYIIKLAKGRVLNNAFHLFLERIISMASVFITGVLIANYLGPEVFGVYSYALSITNIFLALASLGLSSIIIKEIINKGDQVVETLGSAWLLKLLFSIISFIIILAIAFLTEDNNSSAFWLLIILALAIPANSLSVIEYWFQSKLNVKAYIWTKIFTFGTSLLLKFLVLSFGLSIIYIGWVNLFQFMLIAAMLLLIYPKYSGIKIYEWKINVSKISELLKNSWLITLGALSSILFLKSDQIMIRWMLDDFSVGIYSAATQLSELWYLLPTILLGSYFPILIRYFNENSEKFFNRLSAIVQVFFYIALIIAIITNLFAESLILLIFDEAYTKSSSVLVIHIWCAIFVFIRAVISKWIILERIFYFAFLTQFLGLVLNIILNFFLIPEFGVIGAAYGTLAAYFFSSYIVFAVHRKTRVIFYLINRSIFLRRPLLLFIK